MPFNVNNLLNRLANVFTKDKNSNVYQLLGAIGNELDKVDPSQTNLEQSFAVSTATGTDLDMHGADWGIPRRENELDSNYRVRIMAAVPIFTGGPTRGNISTIVQNFTGVAPTIIEYGPDSFFMGVTPMGEFIFDSSNTDKFTFLVQVSNPNNVPYIRQDLENAVNTFKPARSTATFVHQGGV